MTLPQQTHVRKIGCCSSTRASFNPSCAQRQPFQAKPKHICAQAGLSRHALRLPVELLLHLRTAIGANSNMCKGQGLITNVHGAKGKDAKREKLEGVLTSLYSDLGFTSEFFRSPAFQQDLAAKFYLKHFISGEFNLLAVWKW
eukprot:523439-Pelagomonas_calceolata.AAC.2